MLRNYQNFTFFLTEFPCKCFRVNFLADWINRTFMFVLILNIIKLDTRKMKLATKSGCHFRRKMITLRLPL